MKQEPTWFDQAKNVKLLLRGLFLICALLVVLDFIIHRHIYHAWEKIPAFYALYGFIACVILVLLARAMRVVLMRPEDYYERRGDLSDD